VIWQYAILFPDPDQGWNWAEDTVVGLPALVRMLLVLRRAGIQAVVLPRNAEALRQSLEIWQAKKTLPRLIWGDRRQDLDFPSQGPLLAVRGGVLFEPQLIHRFQQAIEDSHVGQACLQASDNLPVLVSVSIGKMDNEWFMKNTFEDLASQRKDQIYQIPPGVFCRAVQELARAGNDRELLATIGKPTDRWHARWVRNWTFPALRWLAQRHVTPNQISVAGFLVGIVGCLLIARGTYWNGVVGAIFLYFSWVLDCMDGTLARLTFSESTFGSKLDTTMGHLINILFFSAVIWAVYGRDALWKAGAFGCLVIGGIVLAHSVIQAERRRRPPEVGKRGYGKFQIFLDKFNHRDYAVLVFVFALLGSFRFFLWGSLIAIQVLWMVHLWLCFKQRRGSQAP
jgi:phosphatidylglycerophosphate synthase